MPKPRRNARADDRIDRALVALIAERGICVRQAAAFKHGRGEVEGGKRADQAMRRVERLGADAALTAAVYRAMISDFVTDEMAAFRARTAED
ncbi:chorismate mutase [Chromobacterium violaceum]|uniref:chorismate mutase n=1 Tax=Chromobacterium violaceum (strain ATCC 12472 / DSM 30191 / JCM 1249 / CCUG 213 / NBRC 12614 / NCIMB 9131 / NCTC 9757 / MK) TaxID=243365 RepID=Q7NRR4_CHRVO|nr:chorismate mutase [Chromobacterium violaceum]AAQ61378.1 hypothetical protein CV_3716 [Chromobacterium violaceum ATCC 12472]SUX88418.1 chorismate mutase [Chromobacterium violaceum]